MIDTFKTVAYYTGIIVWGAVAGMVLIMALMALQNYSMFGQFLI